VAPKARSLLCRWLSMKKRDPNRKLPSTIGGPYDSRKVVSRKAEAFFEDLWRQGDPWEFETSKFERDKYLRQLAILQGHRYARVLEIGCGNGCFTRLLAGIADRLLALDISPAAITQARQAAAHVGAIDFRVANIMDYDPHTEGPWDLVVMSETICYLGWLYSLFDVAWLAFQLFSATCTGGRLLMANTCGGVEDYLLRPWIIRTYRDLCLNVGYQLEAEEIFHGTKNGVDIEVLISLFYKAATPSVSYGR
jgi:SAM-dependent methyltransferase